MTTSTSWAYPGARWWKVDFHTHTPASQDTPWDKSGASLTPEEWLLRFMQAEVDCVAVTDHNTGAWIDDLRGAYQRMKTELPSGFREICLFPGVEISVNGGFHLLALFDLVATRSDIDTLLGAVEYHGTKGDSDAVTRKSAVEVIEAILKAGGLPIPAHADQDKGLLKLAGTAGAASFLDPNTLRQICQPQSILAMEVVDPCLSKPTAYSEARCAWTEVLGSDCHSFQGPGVPGSRFTWIKMASPSLEGLRLALLDGPGVSVRRSDETGPFDPFAVPAHFVESIEIADARYMGRGQPARLSFSPWLNTLVGGRGTGKSTVVHALRLTYRREGELDVLPQENEARKTFENFRKEPQSRQDEHGALDYRATKKTQFIATVCRDGVRHRLRWHQDGNGDVVEDSLGAGWKPSGSQTVTAERFPVRIFSQGQIASLAGESQEALLTVIDDSANVQPSKARLDEAKRRFFALRAQIREFDGRLKAKDEVLVQLNDVRRKLAGFEGKEHTEVLKAFQLRTRQQREIDRQFEAARAFEKAIGDLASQTLPEDLPGGLFADSEEAERAAVSVVHRLHDDLRRASDNLRAAASALAEKVAASEADLASIGWKDAVACARNSYDALVADLHQRGVHDPSEYGKLVQENQRLDSEIEQLTLLEKERADLAEAAGEQLKEVRAARRELTRLRRDFLAKTTSRNPYVRIDVRPYGHDPRPIERSLREELGAADDRFSEDIFDFEDDVPKSGVVAKLLAKLPDTADGAASEIERRLDGLVKRFECAASGRAEFGGHFNNYLQRECARRPELLDRLTVWSPEDALLVEYSPKGDGREFRSIGQASAGQRAAAMLAFLLAHGHEPLVLDQPEDDLDNHLIYDLVVRQIRENKLRRQLIIVTHNPNIVVNGDAEMVHALDFRGGQCWVLEAGSLQEQTIRDEVCRVMEGGREAFLRRYRRLAKGA